MCVCVCIPMCMHACMYVCMYVCICMYVCMCVCMYKTTLLLPLLSLSLSLGANIFFLLLSISVLFSPLFVIQGFLPLSRFFFSFADRERKLCLYFISIEWG